jgi:myo-inositol 2-dehydrogenase / D-chiro-inositol 1-dehydrogenase
VRIGLIGAGAIARRHLEILASRDVEIAAVADTDTDRAGAATAGTGASIHHDWAAMLEGERLDAVLVCTPPGAHAGPTRAALERGIAVYVEKPLAREAADGADIAAAHAAAAGVVCAVGYQWRSLDVLDALRAALGDAHPGLLVSRSYGDTEGGRGDLGTLGGEGSWFTDRARSGGILFELGSHDIDLQCAIGGRVTAVQGMAASGLLALAGREPSGLDDTVSVMLRFAAGGIGVVSVGWNPAQDPAVYTLDVQARDVALALELDPTFHLRGRAHGQQIDATATADPRESSLDRFLEAVRAGDPSAVACTPADALHSLRVALACERAAAEGGTVLVQS